ncbi:MAG: hypothetical protein ACLQVY_14315 [Limisphaerales bacterium]
MNPYAGKTPNRRRFFRWLFSWRTARRATIALACFVTLIALAYTEEDWRGKRAWKQCKAELEAKGDVLDWAAFIPPPMPDEQNFFKAPGINEEEWLGRDDTALSKRLYAAAPKIWQHTNALLIAEVAIVPPGSEALLRIDDTNAPVQARKLIEDAVGPTLNSTQGFTLVSRPLEGIRPARITLSASQKIPTGDLVNLFPRSIDPLGCDPLRTVLRIESAGGNSFKIVLLPPPENAADYLARTDTLRAEFDAIRAALKRPFARMNGNYSQPYVIPMPNFLMMRALAQTLANRVQCHFLLDDSGAALADLTLIHDICRILEAKPKTLMAATMDVAITGIYAYMIAQGLQLGAWREPQLIALQQQLAQTDLLPIGTESFLDARVATTVSLENIPPAELFREIYDSSHGKEQDVSTMEMLKDPFYAFMLFAPHGWVYQNLVSKAKLHPLFEIGDVRKHLVLPEIAERAMREVNACPKWAPYSFVCSRFSLPYATKVWQNIARNQTLVDQAQIACALERYRLAHGDYPETLAALAPQYMEKIPHDIIGGQPLHYRRSPDGTFLLYSIGWNEKDDGGVVAPDNQGLGSGDWVWQGGQRHSQQPASFNKPTR